MKKNETKCDYPIRVPEGNRFSLAILLSKISWEGGWKLKMDWEPKAGDVVRLFLVTPHGSVEVRNLVVEDNLLSFEDKGTLAAGTYDVDIRIVRANGEHYGCYLKGKLRIVQANDEAGISDTYEIDDAVVLYAKGDKGDPGKDGTVSFDELSEDQIAMLKGEPGEDGDDGKSAYQFYLDTVPVGETPLTEAQWLASLKGRQGDQGPKGDTVILADGQTYTLYDVEGSNTDGAMTQKAIADMYAPVTSEYVASMADPS